MLVSGDKCTVIMPISKGGKGQLAVLLQINVYYFISFSFTGII